MDEASTPSVLGEIRRYTKLFWINSGPYNNVTARKFVLRLDPDSSCSQPPPLPRNRARFSR